MEIEKILSTEVLKFKHDDWEAELHVGLMDGNFIECNRGYIKKGKFCSLFDFIGGTFNYDNSIEGIDDFVENYVKNDFLERYNINLETVDSEIDIPDNNIVNND